MDNCAGPLMAYKNVEITQKLLPLSSIYQLEIDSGRYVLVNMAQQGDRIVPNGHYLFAVLSSAFTSSGEMWIPPDRISSVSVDEENIMRVIPAPTQPPEHPGDGIGHTSMTRINGVATRSPAVRRVFYAGELHFCHGQLMSWTNKSGHYRPARPAMGILLPAAVRRLLPLSLYRVYSA